jgi:phosphatidylserine decarboxylase
MMAKLDTLQQHLLPQHTLSRLVGKLINSQQPRLKNAIIHWFIQHYHVDMSEALEPNASHYKNFNDFFTRALRPDARPIVQGDAVIACPNDGYVSQIGPIEEGRIFQAKGRHFNLLELLGNDSEMAALFEQGQFATLYLSPKDYHRVHMPLTGTLRSMLYVPGKLFAVKPNTVNSVNNLFARNERVVCLFETAIGPMAVILVGAVIVASIHTAWSGQVAPNNLSKVTYYNDVHLTLQKGEEMGHFQLGSTAIVLFPKGSMTWDPALHAGMEIKLGQALGRCS